jgi:hypothetical protein
MPITAIESYAKTIKAIESAGLRVFRLECYRLGKQNAQQNLRGKTHYVDDDTLRYHHARILDARAICHGLFFKIIESVSLDMRNTRRGFRVVVFDLFGAVMQRQGLEDCYKSRQQAEKHFYFPIDPQQYYAQRLRELGQIEILQAKRKLEAAQVLEG